MKKTFKKLAATVMAFTMLLGAVSTTASAAESEDTKFYEMLSTVSIDEPFYYVPYDSYDVYNVAPTEHFLAGIPLVNYALPSSFGVYFYINTNIISNSPTSSSNFSICPAYDGYYSLGSISSSNFASSCKMIMARFSKIGNTTAQSALFTYSLSGVENNTAVNSEYNLHQMTSASTTSPSSILVTNTGDSMKKCVYALGDVDRDGDVDSEDVQAVQTYLLGLAYPDFGRNSEDSIYDQIAFELAADFNQDGTISIFDAVGMASYVSTHS